MQLKLTACFLFITLLGLGQKSDLLATQYFNEGLQYFNNGKLSKADSLFTLSLSYSPDMNTYFNKAVVQKQLGNFTGFCENLQKAAVYGDKEMIETYQKNCFTSDYFYVTKDYKKAYQSDYYYKLVFKKSMYNDVQEISTYDTSKKLVECYSVLNYDTTYIKFPHYLDSVILHDMYPKLMQFISKNIHYPELEKEANITGKVYVALYLNKLGQFENPEIVSITKGIVGLGNEAYRVAKMFPPYKPIFYKGRVVKTKFILPFLFRLQ
jgi:tetratricopeptide (TPR) repeat protein